MSALFRRRIGVTFRPSPPDVESPTRVGPSVSSREGGPGSDGVDVPQAVVHLTEVSIAGRDVDSSASTTHRSSSMFSRAYRSWATWDKSTAPRRIVSRGVGIGPYGNSGYAPGSLTASPHANPTEAHERTGREHRRPGREACDMYDTRSKANCNLKSWTLSGSCTQTAWRLREPGSGLNRRSAGSLDATPRLLSGSPHPQLGRRQR